MERKTTIIFNMVII